MKEKCQKTPFRNNLSLCWCMSIINTYDKYIPQFTKKQGLFYVLQQVYLNKSYKKPFIRDVIPQFKLKRNKSVCDESILHSFGRVKLLCFYQRTNAKLQKKIK